MTEVKLVINDPKTGKSYAKTENIDLTGKRIGENISGDFVKLPSFEFEITGGSDTAGFPMRKDVPGAARKSALLSGGVGVNIKRKGMRIRKTVRGNLISKDTIQINLKVTKQGNKKLEEIFPEQVKKTEVKEETKSESKQEANK